MSDRQFKTNSKKLNIFVLRLCPAFIDIPTEGKQHKTSSDAHTSMAHSGMLLPTQ